MPGYFTPWERTHPYTLARKLGLPQPFWTALKEEESGRYRDSNTDPLAVEQAVSRSTDCANPTLACRTNTQLNKTKQALKVRLFAKLCFRIVNP
jgi:hypothetical protein